MTPAVDLARTHALVFDSPRPWSEAEFEALLIAPGVCLAGDATSFVLGRVVADEAEVLTVATAPDARRRGLAKATMIAFEAALPLAVTSVFLEVAKDNIPARNLYKGLGFAAVGHRPGYYTHSDGHAVDALILRKQL